MSTRQSGSEACDVCGHPLADHAASDRDHPRDVCTVKLDTFPDGGFMGVCPCVRSRYVDEYD